MLINNGTLSTTPLTELLIALADERFSGSVVFEEENRTKNAFSVVSGSVGKVRLGVVSQHLGELLVELDLMTEAAIQQTLRASAGNLGQALLGQGLLAQGLSEADLKTALEEQILRRLEHLAKLPVEAVFGLYPERDYLKNWGGPPTLVDPLAAIWRTARFLPRAFATRAIAQLGTDTLRLHRHSRIGRFGFSRRERAVLDVLRAQPQPYASLLATGLLDAPLLEKIVYTLFRTRHFDVGDAAGFPLGVTASETALPTTGSAAFGSALQKNVLPKQKASSSVSAPDQPQTNKSSPDQPAQGKQLSAAELTKFQAELDAFEEKARSLDYYSLLGLEPKADNAAIQAAFFQLAKKWHPDRLPPQLAERRDTVNKLFSRISEAHRTLSNAAQRAEYDRRRVEGDSEQDQAQVEQVLRALTAFQKAEVLVRREDWAGAERLAAEARDGDPEQVEYAALHAWILTKSGQRTPDQGFDDLLAILDRAVTAAPENIRVKLYRAEVLQRAGRDAAAMRDYRTVVEADPQNMVAQRELRLFKMRQQAPTPEAKTEGKGILGRIFRKN